MVDIQSIGSPLSEPLTPITDQPMPGIPKGKAPSMPEQSAAPPEAPMDAPEAQAIPEADPSIADEPQRAPASEAPQLSEDIPLGQKKLNALKDNNYSPEDIADWKASASEKLKAKGFSETDISDYFGDPPPEKPAPFVLPNTQIGDLVKANYQVFNARAVGSEVGPGKQTEAHSTLEAFEAGLQFSTAGLGIRGKMPDMVLPEHAERAFEIASQIGTLAGDMPAMIAGGFLGGSAGALGGGVAGTSVAPVIGTFAGATMGAAAGSGAGAFALPAALRKMMVDHYEKGDITTAREFSNRLMATTWEATKGAMTGVATAAVGGIAGFAAGTVAGTAAATTAKFGADLATMTTVGAALEGHLPSKDDFINGAIVIGGLHAATTLPSKLMNIHAVTGLQPHEIVERAATDVQFKQDLLSDDPKLPPEAQPTRIETVYPTVEEGKAPEMPEHKLVPADTPERAGDAVAEELTTEPDTSPKDTTTGLTDQEAQDRILSAIGEQKDAPKKSLKEHWNNFNAKYLDFASPLLDAVEKANANGAEISDKNNSYQMVRRFSAHMSTVNSFLKEGTRDGNGVVNGEALAQVYKDIPKVDGVQDVKGYTAYAMAQRGLELDIKRGIEPEKIYPGYDRATAEQVIKSGAEKFEAINQRRIAFQNRVLDYCFQKGLLTEEGLKQMKELNQQHFPLNRIQEPDAFTGSTGSKAALKRFFGSDKEIHDPFMQTLLNTEALVKRAMINDARSTFVDNMREGGLLGGEKNLAKGETEDLTDKYLTRVPQAKVKIMVGSEELANALQKQGIEANPDYINVWRAEKQILQPNQTIVYEGGKPVIYEGSPGVIDSLNKLDGDRIAMGLFGKVLKGFVKVLKFGAVDANPVFGAFHFTRGQFMAGVYSKSGLIPFIDPLRVLGDFIKEDKQYKDWQFHGGASGSYFDLDQRYISKNILDGAPSWQGHTWNLVKSLPHAVEGFIQATDNLTRYAEYKKSIKKGLSPEGAAFKSRNVVTDYQMAGLQQSMWRASVAFASAHINSTNALRLAIANDPQGTISKLAAFSMISAGMYAFNKDDKAINDTPDHTKNTTWQFNLTRMSNFAHGIETTEDMPQYIQRVPKPWSSGIMFGSGVEVGLDHLFSDHPQKFEHFAESLMDSLIPEVFPTMFQPIKEQMNNRVSYTQRPIVSQQNLEKLPDLKYEPYTSETAKQLGKIIGYVPYVRDLGPKGVPLAAPVVVENYMRSWSGTAGAWAIRVSDAALAKYGIGNPEAHSADSWADQPFLSSFLMRYPSLKSQSVQDFYENLDAAKTQLASENAYKKNGNTDSLFNLMRLHPELEMQLDGYASGIKTAHQNIQIIQDFPSDKMPYAEKRQLIDTMLFQQLTQVKQVNQMIDDMRKKLKKNPIEAQNASPTSQAGGQ